MLQSFLSQATLIFLSTTLAIFAIACREDKQAVVDHEQSQSKATQKSAIASGENTPLPTISPQPQQYQASEIQPSTFELGLDKAASADAITQSAQSTEDWNLVVTQYQDAIALMKQVDRQSPYFPSAQDNIVQYQRRIKYAQQQAYARKEPPPQVVTQVQAAKAQPSKIVLVVPQPSTKPAIVTKTEQPTINNQQQVFAAPTTQQRNETVVFVAPIKRRIGGTPIIDVTFNGNQQFEMILDTGASGTVITQGMANALGIVPFGKAKANTASAKAVEFPVGYVNSIEVGGVTVNKIPVAIAGTELETGLLGHDFFGDYEITIKRDVVEFRPPSYSGQLNPPETGLTVPTSSKPHRSEEYP
ncbi:retropepsin-like aspartic protease [Fischerella sp. JS2]|uniref:retropepsin-like aspartic protease family protein n=1 Tax=Fischerella sp. JS2 TaxID=2597771 RepID=UPI0028E86468|nr:retropepsin-like aspartic protease [Fischerella sp. JS2]